MSKKELQEQYYKELVAYRTNRMEMEKILGTELLNPVDQETATAGIAFCLDVEYKLATVINALKD